MYHAVDDASTDIYSVSESTLRSHVSWIVNNEYKVISLFELFQSLRNGNYHRLGKSVVLTFDDGYRDFVTTVLPVLQEYGLVATVFLVTGMFGGTSSWNNEEPRAPLLSEDEARYAKARGMGLGSHTATHANLPLLDPPEVVRQLGRSREALTRLGESFHTISYPWGQCSPSVLSAVRGAGYECALRVGGERGLRAPSPYLLPRISVRRSTDAKQLALQIRTSPLVTEVRRLLRAVAGKKSRRGTVGHRA